MNTDGLTVMFADDTSVVVSARSSEELTDKIYLTIREFGEWCARNNLILNTEKTVYINFRTSRLRPEVHLDNNLASSRSAKFLGLYLDEYLSWTSHIDYVSRKINAGYYAISQLRDLVDEPALVNIYYSLVYSHLSYNVILWGNATNSQRIFINQKRIIRLIFRLKSMSSCKPVFRENKIMSFPCLYIYKTLLHIKRKSSEFKTNADFHSYNTRSARALVLDKHKLKKFEKNPAYIGKKLYNKLPLRVQ